MAEIRAAVIIAAGGSGRRFGEDGLPKQFAFIDAALEFIDAVPDWS